MRGYHRGDGEARCALKMNIQKAYDSIELGFVERVLVVMEFPDDMVKWLMLCVTTPSYSVSLNGSLQVISKARRD